MLALGDLLVLKKPHACQTNCWEVLRLGADIRLKCMGCGHIILLTRGEVQRRLKKTLAVASAVDRTLYDAYVAPETIKQLNVPQARN